jgi:hypothetical protein
MRIEKTEVANIKLNSAERLSLEVIDETLKELQNRFTKNTRLTGEKEGTVIEVKELARVRGILDCLLNNSTFEVKAIDN